MSDEEFHRFLERHAPDYNRPPEPPREEMWAAIRTRLPDRDGREGSGGKAPADGTAISLERARRRRTARRWMPWALGVGVAATLTVGFGLGRVTRGTPPAPRPTGLGAAVTHASGGVDGTASAPVRLAAAGHLGEAEAMLTFYRAADREADRAATADWARELLVTTRLLLDSRAGDDPALATLLQDLELVLVQITAAGGEPEDRSLIEDGIEQKQLLPKLRTASNEELVSL
ncbi:MAG TPA: hypothetical protein VK966_07935 [Longimicrobiales bacterium]|nr:hypothetical protein [Longimicrobiales bacterium]